MAEAEAACDHRRFELRQSNLPGAGRGIFTTEVIPARGIVCFYDGVDLADDWKMNNATLSAYLIATPLGTRDGIAYQRTNCGVCQLVNDASIVKITEPSSIKKLWRDVDRYTNETSKLINLATKEHDPWVMYAARELQAGEELFLPYGPSYWISRYGLETKNPVMWLLIQMLEPDKWQDNGGQILYDQKKHILRHVNGTDLDEATARWFIRHVLRVRVDSVLWERLKEVMDDYDAMLTPLAKVQALVRHLSTDGEVFPAEYEYPHAQDYSSFMNINYVPEMGGAKPYEGFDKPDVAVAHPPQKEGFTLYYKGDGPSEEGVEEIRWPSGRQADGEEEAKPKKKMKKAAA